MVPLTRWLAIAAMSALCVFSALISYNVAVLALYRWLDVYWPSVMGLEEMISLALGPCIAFCMPYCQISGGHISFKRQSQLGRNTTMPQLMVKVLTTLMLLILCVYFFLGTLDAYADQLSSAVLDWPTWPFQALSVLGCALWTLCSALELKKA